MCFHQRSIYHGEQAPTQTEISRSCSPYILELLFRYLPYWLRSCQNSISPSTIHETKSKQMSTSLHFPKKPEMAGSSARPTTPTSANSIVTFAESLHIYRTPSPTDDEAEQIWEAARTAPPIFPDLQLTDIDSDHIDENRKGDAPTNFHLGPAQRALVHDTIDAAGHRRSVLLIYEADDEGSTLSSPAPSQCQRIYDDCVTGYTHLSFGQSQAWPIHSSSRRYMPQSSAASATASQPMALNKSATLDKGKSKPKFVKLKQAFKLAEPSKNGASISTQTNQVPTKLPISLPNVQPVQLQSSGPSQSQPTQPISKKVVGHLDRMTRWGDFSQYKAEEEAAKSILILPSLNLNKPLPDIPPSGSHLRMTRAPETLSTSSALPLPNDRGMPLQGRSAHRRTAVYAGSLFSSQELSEEEVIDLYGSSRPTSPIDTQTPATSDEDEGERERRELLERRHCMGRPTPESTTVYFESPYRSPELSDSVNDEIGRLTGGLRRSFDPDADDDKSPMVDTFVHAGHTSFLITERLNENTIRSMYGTQERRDVDSPTDDPTKAIWNTLRSQVGGGGWNGE